MANLTADLGRMVLSGLVGLKAQKGKISLEDVGSMFLTMSAEHAQKASEADRIMHEEISRLAAYIDEANREIFAISTNEKSEDAIMDASLHLDEVVKATEQATNSIMDAADAIQQAASGLGGDKEKAIIDATTRIYDACNFQDITGQRINKVIKLLSNIEQRVGKLNTLLKEVADNNSDNVVQMTKVMTDKDLLNGPQLSGQAASQEDIDKLFASLGGN
jgi:chemotaxis protein CheZ